MMNTKKMFTKIVVNMFIPIDINKLSKNTTLIDLIDDEPEALTRYQYPVSISIPMLKIIMLV